jgi:hypothetical protein
LAVSRDWSPFQPPGPGAGTPKSGHFDRHLTKNKKRTIFTFRSGRGGVVMFRAVVEEAAALASISLFLGMLAVWVQVFSSL